MAKHFLHFVRTTLPRVLDCGMKIPAGSKVLLALTTTGSVIRHRTHMYPVTKADLLQLINVGIPLDTDWEDKALAWLETQRLELVPMSRRAKYLDKASVLIKHADGSTRIIKAFITRTPLCVTLDIAGDKMGTLHRTLLGGTYFIPTYPTY